MCKEKKEKEEKETISFFFVVQIFVLKLQQLFVVDVPFVSPLFFCENSTIFMLFIA